jgi:hypothetical protein
MLPVCGAGRALDVEAHSADTRLTTLDAERCGQ